MNRQNYYFCGILPKHNRVALRGNEDRVMRLKCGIRSAAVILK